jgi:hypothetical protein
MAIPDFVETGNQPQKYFCLCRQVLDMRYAELVNLTHEGIQLLKAYCCEREPVPQDKVELT